MKRILKLSLLFLISSILIFPSIRSFGQPRGMTMSQVFKQVNKQTMNQQMQMHMNTMGNRYWQYAGSGNEYTVVFKDSSQENATSFMYRDSISHKSFLVFVDKKFPKSDTLHRFQKIYADQTIGISAESVESGETLIGLPTDSCWSFKVISGPLALYAKDADYLKYQPRKEIDFALIIGIQLNNGPIEKMTDENLSTIMSTNAKALEFLNKNNMPKRFRGSTEML